MHGWNMQIRLSYVFEVEIEYIHEEIRIFVLCCCQHVPPLVLKVKNLHLYVYTTCMFMRYMCLNCAPPPSLCFSDCNNHT